MFLFYQSQLKNFKNCSYRFNRIIPTQNEDPTIEIFVSGLHITVKADNSLALCKSYKITGKHGIIYDIVTKDMINGELSRVFHFILLGKSPAVEQIRFRFMYAPMSQEKTLVWGDA